MSDDGMLGKYKVECELGRGAMGVVYKSTDPDTGHPVAVKVLPNQLASNPSFVNRFRREILTLKRLKHPGIISVLDEGEQDGAHFYVMEFVDGTTLEKTVRGAKRIDLLEALDIVLDIARVLEHIHANGVIHRDLKPSNIMITKQGLVKVTDFGIAKLVDATRMTATQGLLGTVEYMSPEQSQGRFVDPRSDIYSLGVILYRCTTGHAPISGTNTTEVIMKLRTQQIEQPIAWVPDLPAGVSELIMHMLEKDPAKRVPSAKALVRELERVRERVIAEREGRATVVSEAKVLRSRREEPSHGSRLWLVLAAAVLVGIAALVFVATRTPPTEEVIEKANILIEAGRESDALALLRKIPPEARTDESRDMETMLESRRTAAVLARQAFRLAAQAENLGREEFARDLFQAIVTRFPDDSIAEKAAGRAAEITHRLSRRNENGAEAEHAPDAAPDAPAADAPRSEEPTPPTPQESHGQERTETP